MEGNQNEQPCAAVYAGSGASHSWIWFAEVFDRAHYHRVFFIDERDIACGVLDRCDVLLVSGGDTFAIAEALGKTGAERIQEFVSGGGIYIGSCAGAYLALRSSLAPLNLFNFVSARIGNLASHVPVALKMPEKCCTQYGCRYVVHPVRGEVIVSLQSASGAHARTQMAAPLYGGPAMLASEDVEVFATYVAFTDATEFLMDRDVANTMFLGSAAALRKEFGKGVFYLFGPHCEHPDFPQANRLLLDIIWGAAQGKRLAFPCDDLRREVPADPSRASQTYRSFVSSLSNARIVAHGITREAYRWRIGRKVYDPEKILVMLEAVFSRARLLDRSGVGRYVPEVVSEKWLDCAGMVLDRLRELRRDGNGPAGHRAAQELLGRLRAMASEFLNMYFSSMRVGFLNNDGRLSCTTTTSISRRQRRSIPCRL